jgi:dephospho-CoA kinase
VPTIDSDTLAREAIAPGTPGFRDVVQRFGQGIVGPSGDIDRQKLGVIVFADPSARKELEAIIHPAVRSAIDAWFASLDPRAHGFAVAELPLLYELNREKYFDEVIVAACDPATQLRRVTERLGSDWKARERLAAQLPIDDKVRRANYVIRTDGSLADTDKQIKRIWESLTGQP